MKGMKILGIPTNIVLTLDLKKFVGSSYNCILSITMEHKYNPQVYLPT
jgi:hypothetical protein